MAVNRKILLCTSMFAGAMFATGAVAQQQPATQNNQPIQTTQSSSSSEATEVQSIVVTGSRIRNKEFTSASPVQVLTNEVADLRGQPDVAQTILQSTLAISSFQINDQLTGYVTAGGGGTQSVALRGAGPQRTLTILNGRRAGPSGTRGQVQAFDLGVIPGSMVERTEILKDGASSIYGSDAVAGVINIITRTDLDGGRLNAFYSAPFDGGGEQVRLDGAYGRTFDRGYANISFEYLESKAQLRRDRDYTSCTTDYMFSATTGERLDYIDPETGSYKCYNLNSNYVGLLGSNMNIVRMKPGYDYPTAAQGNNSPVAGWARFNRNGFADTFLYTPSDNEYWQNSTVISPQERYSLYATAGYKLSDNVELYGELLYNKRKSSQVGVGQVFPSFAQLNTLYGVGNNVSATNPNNPFGENIQPVGIYESSSFQDIDYYRGILGIKGTTGKWDWDVYGQYTLSDATYNNGPRIYLDRLAAVSAPGVACQQNLPGGVNVSNYNCADLPGGLDWTSERVLTGNFSDAERNFLFFNEDHTTRYDHAFIEAVVSTAELFNLPAGPVGAAFGAQIRQEKLDDLPGYQARNRNVALYSTAGQTKGEDTVREVFAEFDLPLLRDVPFAQSLSLNVSGRLSDYDSYGDSTTYKAGLNWQIVPAVRIRSSFGTSFRAPALYEQFLGAQIGYGGQTVDPCYDYTENTNIEQKVLAGCILDNASITTGGSSVAIATVGGRDLLEAETAESFSLGIVLQPEFAGISGLNIAVDYWEFAIENAVSRLGAGAIIERCYEQSTSGTLDSGYCGLFERIRNPGGSDDGKLATVNDAYVNVAEQNYRGIDVSASWAFDLLDLGRMTISTQHSYKLEDTETFEGTTESYLGNSFNYNGPRYSGQVSLNLNRDRWSYYYGISLIGRSSDIDLTGGGGEVFNVAKYGQAARYTLTTPLHDNHSASVRYRGDGWNVTVGMQNIWDKSPPTVGSNMFRIGNAALNGYDMRGRRMSIRFGKTF